MKQLTRMISRGCWQIASSLLQPPQPTDSVAESRNDASHLGLLHSAKVGLTRCRFFGGKLGLGNRNDQEQRLIGDEGKTVVALRGRIDVRC